MGDEKGLKFPSVWDWSLQFTAKDRTLFLNPLYVGKSTPCMQNGAVKSFRRTKVNGHAPQETPGVCSCTQKSLPMAGLPVWRDHVPFI